MKGKGKKSNITTCYSIRVSCMQPYTYIYQCTVYFHDINWHASISPWISLFRVSSKASLEVFSSLSICWSGDLYLQFISEWQYSWQFSLSALGIYYPTFSWLLKILLWNMLRDIWMFLCKFQAFMFCFDVFVFFSSCFKILSL